MLATLLGIFVAEDVIQTIKEILSMVLFLAAFIGIGFVVGIIKTYRDDKKGKRSE